MPEKSKIPVRFAYYDRDVDIAWIPTGSSQDIVGDEQSWGLIVRDRESGSVVALEIWSASQVLPKAVLDALPDPGRH